MAQVKKPPTSSQFLATTAPAWKVIASIITSPASHSGSPQLHFNIQGVPFFSTTTQDLAYNVLSTFQTETREKHFPEGEVPFLNFFIYSSDFAEIIFTSTHHRI